MTSGSTNILAVGNSLENNATTALGILDLGQTPYDEQNPFVSGGPGVLIQGTAYGAFSGGIQDQFESGSWGSLGGLTVEGALDLYRIQAVNNAPGQYGLGNAVRTGEFQGTVVIDQSGNVSFVTTVPEPSSSLLLGVAAAGLGFIMRRRKATGHA
jgi:hypothetical protein